MKLKQGERYIEVMTREQVEVVVDVAIRKFGNQIYKILNKLKGRVEKLEDEM